MDFQRRREISRAHFRRHLRDLPREQIGGDGNDAARAERHERERQRIVAAHDEEIRIELAHEPRNLVAGTAGFLHADDVRERLAQADDRFDGNFDAAASGNGIEHDRLVRRGSDFGEMAVDAFLPGLVVIRSDVEKSLRAELFRLAREQNRLVRGVGARSREHGNAARGELDRLRDDFEMLFVRQRRRFAGRSDGKDAVNAADDLEIHEFLQVGIIDRAVPHRRDQRRPGAGINGRIQDAHKRGEVKRIFRGNAMPFPRQAAKGRKKKKAFPREFCGNAFFFQALIAYLQQQQPLSTFAMCWMSMRTLLE